MKKITLLLTLLLSVLIVSAQDDLDDIFDDGDSTPDYDIKIGTDLVTTIAGTANVFGEFIYKQKVGLQIGVGVMPFGYIMDASNSEAFSTTNGLRDTNVNKGFFFDFGLKYIQAYGDVFQWYYYGNLKKWSYNSFSPDNGAFLISKKKVKFNFGTGYAYKPYPNIGFDAHFGIYMGMTKKNSESYPKIYSGNLEIGFDLGLGLFYNF